MDKYVKLSDFRKSLQRLWMMTSTASRTKSSISSKNVGAFN